jgi:von Willebrand factor type A domain
MRSRNTVSFFAVFFLLPLVLVPGARAARKRQTVIIALDQSGSMVQSDPAKLRIEAAGLLAATLDANDRVGLIGFGDSAQWLRRPVARSHFDFRLLEKAGASDPHTAFSPVLNAVEQYLLARPSLISEDNEISLVLLTDGHSDPADKNADADQSRALASASRNGNRLKIYTIGLGNDFDREFLEQLARPSNGISISAASATDLPNAFLRVAARVAALPVYQRMIQPGKAQWAGSPNRIVVVFTGAQAESVQISGNAAYRSPHVLVEEVNPAQAHGSVNVAWRGNGTAFLCMQQPLTLAPQVEFPAALLTDAPQPISLDLQGPQDALKDAFFLQSATAHLELTGPDREIVSLQPQAGTGVFAGSLEAQTAGVFRARAYLDSPYGQVETFLGEMTVSVTPVAMAQQVSAGVFDPLPRRWFPKKVMIQPLLPVGAVHLRFSRLGPLDGLPENLIVAPGQKQEINLVLLGAPGTMNVEDYSATWSDGKTQITRHGAVHVLTSQMTPAQLIRDKWPWMAAAITLLLAFIGSLWSFWPRPLQADLIVRQNGTQVLRLQLPDQLRTRTLHVSESENGECSGSDRAVIAGSQSRELLSLQSARRRGRWTIVAHPRAARVQAQQCRKWSEIDLRAIHVPVFYTDDGTIQINVLYS